MERAPKALVDLLNLPGQALSRIISTACSRPHWRRARFCASPTAHLRLDLAKFFAWPLTRFFREFGWLSSTSLRTLVSLLEFDRWEAILDLKLYNLWIAWGP